MAFFEVVETLFDTVSNLIKQVGGRSLGGYVPDWDYQPYTPGQDEASAFQVDGDGALCMRGPVLTDEGSFRSDFYAPVSANLTGTCTFTSSSKVVTGSGTLFTSELTRRSYIKLSSDPGDCWRQVGRIISDTELWLEDDYQTPGGGTGTGVKTNNPTYVWGTGPSVSQSGSTFVLSDVAGTGVAAGVTGFRAGDYSPMQVEGVFAITQRVAQQVSFFGFYDNMPFSTFAPKECACFEFSGATNTAATCISARDANDINNTETTTVTLPFGGTTTLMHRYRVELNRQGTFFYIDDVLVASHRTHVPNLYSALDYYYGIRHVAGYVGSATSFVIDSIYYNNADQVDVQNTFRGAPVGTRVVDDSHTVTGTVTTTAGTETTIIDYTIPTGKTAYLIGFSASSGTSTINGNPVKIGRGTNPITVPPAPGSLDSTCIRSFFLPQKTTYAEDMSGCPRFLAGGGEHVLVTVTPDGGTSTVWRSSLDIILR